MNTARSEDRGRSTPENPVRTDSRRMSLGQFLRARREQIQPSDVGLATIGRRRTPGLRREEVAALAHVGITWYTWLEQGRDIGVSTSVVDSIGEALRLEGADLQHFYELAGKQAPGHAASGTEVRSMLDRTLGGVSTSPAYVVDRYWNVVSANYLAEYIFEVRVGSNCLERFFTDPKVSARYPHRELAGQMMAAQFRRHAGVYSDDRTFGLVAEKIARISPDFRRYWDGYLVSANPHLDVVYDHHELGRLTFESVVLNPVDSDDLRVFLYHPKEGSGTSEALSRASRSPNEQKGCR